MAKLHGRHSVGARACLRSCLPLRIPERLARHALTRMGSTGTSLPLPQPRRRVALAGCRCRSERERLRRFSATWLRLHRRVAQSRLPLPERRPRQAPSRKASRITVARFTRRSTPIGLMPGSTSPNPRLGAAPAGAYGGGPRGVERALEPTGRRRATHLATRVGAGPEARGPRMPGAGRAHPRDESTLATSAVQLSWRFAARRREEALRIHPDFPRGINLGFLERGGAGTGRRARAQLRLQPVRAPQPRDGAACAAPFRGGLAAVPGASQRGRWPPCHAFSVPALAVGDIGRFGALP
jgi:hypothetical protein